MSERRFHKWQLYAVHADKTMTQVVEELIDSLPILETDKNETAPLLVSDTQKSG